MLWVVSGNDPERLGKELARKIKRLRSPFESEKILVDTSLKSFHLQTLLAKELGIFSGITITPPGNFLWSVLSECFPDAPPNNPLSKISMSFSLMELFSKREESGNAIRLPDGIPLPGDIPSQWELAITLAEIFDRILIYRPDWILIWEKDQHHQDPWSDLWRSLIQKTPLHRVSLLERFSRLVRASPESLKGKSFLKTPVHVIGHSLLPPSFLDFLKDLSILTDVVLYQWQATPIFLLPGFSDQLPGDAQGAAVNPLTRALGAQFVRMRDLCLSRSGQTEEFFSIPDRETILSKIQSEIINDRSGLDLSDAPLDHSLRIVVSRTPMGEVQALYHEIVLSFRRDSSLMSSDVLVMVSDIELFAPFIDAVFQKKIGEVGEIPYRIVGKGGGGESFKYLENCARVARGKCSASEVMALLDHPYSRERFGLDQEEVERIERWISRLPVWWGISPETREAFGSPEPALNTFFWGVERLLLSFPFAQSAPVEDMMPFDGGDLWEVAPVLEKFQVFIKLVLDLAHRLPDEESGFFWGETASWMAMNLFTDDFGIKEPEIYTALISFSRMLSPVDDENEASRMASLKIPYDGFLRMLEHQMKMAKGDSPGKMGHGVTFAPIVSSRGISSRFLALLGMNSELFTLKDRMVSFDPLMNAPRSGDHSRREDDQGMFLESVLSAKDSLFISYSGTGQEPFDEILPSVPLGHLIDWIRAMKPECENLVKRWSLVEGFSQKKESVQNTGFPSIPLPDDLSEDIPACCPMEIELDDLKGFFRNPARFFWSSWGGGALKNTLSSLASNDPFVPGLMESRFLGKTIFSYLNEHDGEIPPKCFLTPFGFLPHGSASGSVFESLSSSVFRLWKEKDFLFSQYPGSEIPLHELSLSSIPEMIGQTFRFHGSLDGQVFLKGNDVHHVMFFPYYHSKRDILSLWVDHLLLSLCFQDKIVVSTIYSLSGSGSESYCVKGGAKRALQDLFAIFCYGEIFPVPIFLKSSWEYADCWKKFRKKEAKPKSGKVSSDFSFDPRFPWGDPNGADRRKALEKAEKIWISQQKTPDISPEEMILYAKASPWTRLPGSDPEQLLPSEKMALRVFSPILGSVVDEKKKKTINAD